MLFACITKLVMSKYRYQFEEVKWFIDSKNFFMTNSLEKELAVIMKITPKVNDVNDIFADISITPATIISAIATCSYICTI